MRCKENLLRAWENMGRLSPRALETSSGECLTKPETTSATGMFSSLFDLKLRRTALQAVGFYFAYLVLLMIVGGIAGAISGILFGTGFQTGVKIGQCLAILACLGLSLRILQLKGILSFGNVLLALVAGLLAIIGGALLGLIPVSFLTVKPGSQTTVVENSQ